MNGRARVAVIAAVAAAIATVGITPSGAASPPTLHPRAVEWPQYHGTPNHRGFNRLETKVGPDNVSSLSLAWIGNGAQSGEDLASGSSPVVVGGYVYFGTIAGQLLAFHDTCSGSLCDPAWRVDLGQTITDTPAYADGVLYVGTSSRLGFLYAFDTKTCAEQGSCEPIWKGKVNDNGSSPTIADGVVYVGSYDTGLYAFDAEGCGQDVCKPLWIGTTEGTIVGSPAVSHGAVLIGDSTGTFLSFDADGCGRKHCRPTWTATTSAPIFDSPAVSHGIVYFGTFAEMPDARLEAFDARGCGRRHCSPIWEGTGGHYFSSSPAIAYGTVYIGSGDGMLIAYDAKGCGASLCNPIWKARAAGPVATMASPPMVANGVVYVGENQQRIYAFAAHGCGASLCDELWEFITQDPLVDSSPVMVNHTLYVTGSNFGAVPELYVFTLGGT